MLGNKSASPSMPVCNVFHRRRYGASPFMTSPLQGRSLSLAGGGHVSVILTPSSGPSALASQSLPCARLESGQKGAVSLDKSKLYSWGTLTTPHLLSSNGLSCNKVRTTVSHRFHRTSESLQEAATLAGDQNEVHPLVVKLTVSFLPSPPQKNL